MAHQLRTTALTLALLLVLAACAGSGTTATTEAEPTGTTTATTGAPATTAGPATTAAAEPFRVALIYPGTAEDLSWSNAWYDGAQAAVAANPTIELETVDLINDVDAAVAQGAAFATEGYDFIFIVHGGLVDAAIQLAEQFPDTLVCLAPHQPESTDGQAANLCWVEIDQHHANFFTGVIAGLATKTNQIAAVNGFEFPALTRQPETFYLGARCVNPDITFSQEYINSWVDTGLAKAATQALIAGGADIVMGATDSAVLGVIEGAAEAGAWAIPSYFDSYEIAPETVLTTAVHGLQFAGQDVIERAFRGELEPLITYDAVNNPGLSAAPLYANESALTADQLAIFQGIEQQVRDGQIVIPDETTGDITVGSVGAGGEIDPASIGCG
jgi:basic membrane protein A